MNKYERNIQQIRDRGESAEMYFLDKLQEECAEVIRAVEVVKFVESCKAFNNNYFNKCVSDVAYVDLSKERCDLKNVLKYLDMMLPVSFEKEFMEQQLDRGYERGRMMGNIKSCLFCQYSSAEEYPFEELECGRIGAPHYYVKSDFVCELFELDFRMRKVLEGEVSDENK